MGFLCDYKDVEIWEATWEVIAQGLDLILELCVHPLALSKPESAQKTWSYRRSDQCLARRPSNSPQLQT